MVDSGVDIVGDGVVVDLGDNVDGGEGESDGDGVSDSVDANVEDIVVDVVGIDVLSLFLKSVASNCSFASQINLILQSGGAADLNCSNVCLL